VAVLSAPSEIGTVCGDNADVLQLDGSLSFGYAGTLNGVSTDASVRFEWTYAVDGAPPTPLYTLPTSSIVNNQTVAFSSDMLTENKTVALSSDMLAVDTPYRFTLRVIDERGVASPPVSAIVTKRDRSLLKATATAPLVVCRSQSTPLVAVATVCAQSVTPIDTVPARRLLLSPLTTLTYQWTQKGGPPLDMAAAAIVAVDFRQYRVVIPPGLLQVFGTYTFEVAVAAADASLETARANVTFIVAPSPPVALIAGSQYRSVPHNGELALDAASSFDPDYVTRSSTTLAFFWPFPTLADATPMKSACQQQHDAFIFAWITLDYYQPTLTLPASANALCVGLQYKFEVVVSHANLPPAFADAATATAFTMVVADGPPPPPAAGSIAHTLAVRISNLDADKFSLAAYPEGERLRLQATVTHTTVSYLGVLQRSDTGILSMVVEETSRVTDTHMTRTAEDGYMLQYRWSETNAIFNARAAANLGGAADMPAFVLTSGVMTLARLSPAPAATMRLDVSLMSALGAQLATAFTMVDVVINAAPTVEAATVDATVGTAGVTQFHLECVGAADENQPLAYQFMYADSAAVATDAVAVANTTAVAVWQPLTDRLDLPNAEVTLPVGNLVVACVAFDALNARSLRSLATPPIAVLPLRHLVDIGANGTCSASSTLTELMSPAVLSPTQLSLATALQQLNSYFTSVIAEDCDALNCDVYDMFVSTLSSLSLSAAAAGDLNDAGVQQIAASIALISNNSTLTQCASAFAATQTIISDVTFAIATAGSGTNSSAPVGDGGGLTDDGTDAALNSLATTLSSLITTIGQVDGSCEQYESLSTLVDTALSASSAGSVAGEDVSGLNGDAVVATTVRVDGATSASSGGATFNFAESAVAGRGCTDIQIVEVTAPIAAKCRNDGGNGGEGVDMTGTGIDEPVSSIVRADLVDCDGNVLDVNNLTEPISFFLPLNADALLAPSTVVATCSADTSYLPNNGAVALQLITFEKEVECSYYDEDEGRWSSDGCVVADANVTMADGSKAVRCECTHLTEFAILLRSKNSQDTTSCNLSPSGVFGSIIFLVFAFFFSMLLLLGLRQTYLTVWAFGAKQKTMLVQHCLLCAICILRIFVCVVYYMLQYESVRAKIEFKAVAAVSGLPYVLMLWLFSLLVANWASIYYAAKADNLRGIGSAFDKIRPYFFGANLAASLLFISLFTTLALSEDADQRKVLTLTGTVIYSIIVLVLSVAYACYGYGLMVQLSKDFKSSSAERLCKVGVVFCICFAGEAGIWLLSGTAPVVFFANFEIVNSIFFTLDLIALCCILLVTRKTLSVGIKNKTAKSLTTPFGCFSRKPKPGMSMKAMANKNGKKSRGSVTSGSTGAGSVSKTGSKGGKAVAKRGSMTAASLAAAVSAGSKRKKPRLLNAAKKFRPAPPVSVSKDKFAAPAAPKSLDPDDPSNDAVPLEKRVMLTGTSDEEIDDVFVSKNGDGGGTLRRHSSFSAQGDMLVDIESLSRESSRETTPRVLSRRKSFNRSADNTPRGGVCKARAVLSVAEALSVERKNSFDHWITAIDDGDDDVSAAAAALGLTMGESGTRDASSGGSALEGFGVVYDGFDDGDDRSVLSFSGGSGSSDDFHNWKDGALFDDDVRAATAAFGLRAGKKDAPHASGDGFGGAVGDGFGAPSDVVAGDGFGVVSDGSSRSVDSFSGGSDDRDADGTFASDSGDLDHDWNSPFMQGSFLPDSLPDSDTISDDTSEATYDGRDSFLDRDGDGFGGGMGDDGFGNAPSSSSEDATGAVDWMTHIRDTLVDLNLSLSSSSWSSGSSQDSKSDASSFDSQ
jgi:hypothetical protein